ncbi:tRNA (adenosine(37)-N6)-threonylcarbamoyltransferase complex dimerization subunit type 1 TsaB [Rhizosphaericola mali]|uniref:tRNA (Adenosine(37)-N6)-threonylcarbamoyltransferase complex dimerization subunit type 1 TsaB n=1 Tax=Rhizosphaericola mali TaxID=2545455 RepID=A0A5P2G5K1_9BACT|nr:tRNA (adenosine(37)-N6)-threonylcarbamoyltransferase complex dimerization subunit type 1 TsaB [Rhizosphaericola mali]QES89958.1 tRNA (adenosine(37)-N6)-threonylcarbamoyltransferase complex dimerization subunit type 1 TsaB [Rhizosphaericola mali]
MSLILSLDASTDRASVGLYRNNEKIDILENFEQRDHASFIQPAVVEILDKSGVLFQDLDAIAVTEGPGSYTGLRVAMASAKGVCYAQNKPLILVNTLQAMALAAKEDYVSNIGDALFFCPMIDARRLDVFTAIYNQELELLTDIQAITLEATYWDNWLEKGKLLFSGNGASKLKPLLNVQANAQFLDVTMNVSQVNTLAQAKFAISDFSDVAYSQPNYFKEFYTTAKPTSTN